MPIWQCLRCVFLTLLFSLGLRCSAAVACSAIGRGAQRVSVHHEVQQCTAAVTPDCLHGGAAVLLPALRLC